MRRTLKKTAKIFALALTLAVIAVYTISASTSAQKAVAECHKKGGVILDDDKCYIYTSPMTARQLD